MPEAEFPPSFDQEAFDPKPDGQDPNSPPFKARPVNRENRMDLVAYFFSQGKTVSQILDILETDYQITGINRETPYLDLAYAANHRWFSYNPPTSLEWANQIQRRCPRILESTIPNWGARMAVITEGAKQVNRSIYYIAKVLVDEYALDWRFPMMRYLGEPRRSRICVPDSKDPKCWWENDSRTAEDLKDPRPAPMEVEVRIGFSGGDTMGRLAYELGRLLEKDIAEWERELKLQVFKTLDEKGLKDRIPTGPFKRRFEVKIRLMLVNLVAGFGASANSHPIGFLTAMIEKSDEIKSRAKLKCFNAPPFVRIGEREQYFHEFDGARNVRDFVRKNGLDIVVTSGGSIDDPHSLFQLYYQEHSGEDQAESAHRILQNHGVEGDLLWQPITSQGPISLENELSPREEEILRFSPMSLMTLDDLLAHRQAGRDVVLVLGPCGKCDETKDRVLRAILTHPNQIVSHLIADRLTVERAFGPPDRED